MKWIALLIAIGSVIGGITLSLWPKPPCPPAVWICLSGLSEALVGGCTLISGIVLLFLIFLVSLRYRVLSIIGTLMNYALALLFLGSTAFWINFPINYDRYEPIKIIIGIGFLCAGLSASVIKNKIAGGSVQRESSGKTL